MILIIAAFIACFGLLIIGVCLWSLFRRQWLFDLAWQMLDRTWLMPVAVGARLLLGAALLWVAAESSWPVVFRALGWLSIIAALSLPFVGPQRIRRLIEWMDDRPRVVMQLWMGFGVVLGLVLLLGVRTILI